MCGYGRRRRLMAAPAVWERPGAGALTHSLARTTVPGGGDADLQRLVTPALVRAAFCPCRICGVITLRCAQAQVGFFERAIPFLRRATDESLLEHVHAYHAFLLGRARDEELQPSFEVEVVWRAHLLSPIEYAEVSAFTTSELQCCEIA